MNSGAGRSEIERHGAGEPHTGPGRTVVSREPLARAGASPPFPPARANNPEAPARISIGEPISPFALNRAEPETSHDQKTDRGRTANEEV